MSATGQTASAPASLEQLREKARLLRIHSLRMTTAAGSGHPTSCLSAAEMMAATFFHAMKFDPANPNALAGDRFVLSKGHAAPILYAALAESGVFPVSRLMTLRQFSSELEGHPTPRIPGVDAATGSLGQGLSVGAGLALGARLQKSAARVYVLMGDGESEEGQIWEAAMAAPKYKLDNLCVILDHNKGQIDGYVKDVMNIEPIADKWRAFNWNVLTIDGHDYQQIAGAFQQARATKDKPTFIIAETVKGKGVSFMENQIGWHGVAPTKEQLSKAVAELQAAQAAVKGAA